MQLMEAEASFRALKSEVSIRPLFHQKEAARQGLCHGGVSGLCAVTLKHPLQRRPALARNPAENVGNPAYGWTLAPKQLLSWLKFEQFELLSSL
jgi:hypothetical protein